MPAPHLCHSKAEHGKDVKELSENKIHASVYFFMTTLHWFLATALVEMSYSTSRVQHTRCRHQRRSCALPHAKEIPKPCYYLHKKVKRPTSENINKFNCRPLPDQDLTEFTCNII